MKNEIKFIVGGSSTRKEFVICSKCFKEFSWLKAIQVRSGVFIAMCYKCRNQYK